MYLYCMPKHVLWNVGFLTTWSNAVKNSVQCPTLLPNSSCSGLILRTGTDVNFYPKPISVLFFQKIKTIFLKKWKAMMLFLMLIKPAAVISCHPLEDEVIVIHRITRLAKNKQVTINPQNNDEECFKYASLNQSLFASWKSQ